MEEKVQKIIMMENLQYIVSREQQDLENCDCKSPRYTIKGDYKIGLLRNRDILELLFLVGDFVNVNISTKGKTSNKMRPLIYGHKFKNDEETTEAMAWISFLDLLPIFFKEAPSSVVTATRKPIYLDMTITNKIRHVSTRVKFLVDLVVNLSELVAIEEVSDKGQETKVKRINIQYNLLSKYNKRCKLKSHKKVKCRVLYPKLRKLVQEGFKVNKEGNSDNKTLHDNNMSNGKVIDNSKRQQKIHN